MLDGKKMRAIRRKRGWTLTDLFMATGIDASDLGKMERAPKRGIRLSTLNKLAAALEVNPVDLLREA